MYMSCKPTFDMFILGCGRSGTSLVAGLFRNAGFFMGRQLRPARDSNPKGFFEDGAVNRLNEDIVAGVLPQRDDPGRSDYCWDIPMRGHRWLSRLDLNRTITSTDQQIDAIRAITINKPFCLKDPRFCYTLHLWRPYAKKPKFICVFREPSAFVASVFKECLTMPYLHNLAISVHQLFDIWLSMYRHVLERHSTMGDWLFVEYESILSGEHAERLSEFTGIEIDQELIDPQLNRSKSDWFQATPPQGIADTLARLRARTSCRI
jgi:Sulfotransferase family